MSRGKRISREDALVVHNLSRTMKSHSKVASALGKRSSYVKRILASYDEHTGEPILVKRRGRPRKISANEETRIREYFQHNQQTTLKQAAAELGQPYHIVKRTTARAKNPAADGTPKKPRKSKKTAVADPVASLLDAGQFNIDAAGMMVLQSEFIPLLEVPVGAASLPPENAPAPKSEIELPRIYQLYADEKERGDHLEYKLKAREEESARLTAVIHTLKGRIASLEALQKFEAALSAKAKATPASNTRAVAVVAKPDIADQSSQTIP